MSDYKSHEENRKKICALCGTKIVLNGKKINSFNVTAKNEELIKKYVNSQYSTQIEKFPSSICNTCRITLIEREQNIVKRSLPSMPNYADLQLRKNTRSLNPDEICKCYICITARYTGHPKTKKGRSQFKKTDAVKICKHNGMFACKHSIARGAISQDIVDKDKSIKIQDESSMKICTLCFKKLAPGMTHSCATDSSRRKVHTEAVRNVNEMIKGLPEKNKLQIVHSILKDKINSLDNVRSKGVEVELNTHGRSRNITLTKKGEKNVIFLEEKLDNFQNVTGSSSNHMRKLANFIRSTVGRKSIPKNYQSHMSEKSKSLEDCYKTGEYEFDIKKGEPKQSRPVVWADSETLLEAVIRERNYIGNYLIKVMADGGQGSFKVSMTILPEDYERDCDNNEDNDSEPVVKKRKLYSEGGTVGQKAKLTSVNRLIMLCVVSGILETYDNIKVLFELIEINKIPFKFVADFKLLLIVNGQQTATSTYPCPYCFVTLNDLRNTDRCSLNESCDELKTYGDLKSDYEKFCLLGTKKNAKDFRNTINLPLFAEDNDVRVIDKCVIPELHILQGVVNHVFWDGLLPILGRERAILWPTKLKLIAKNFHGEAFEGNACRRLLKEADRLKDPEICGQVGELRILPFIHFLKSMNKVVQDCFSIKCNEVDLDFHIKELRKSFEAIESLTQTLKIHVTLKHLKHCLVSLEERGLGFWSEQAGESVHHAFLQYWAKYKVNDMKDENYVVRLKRAVVEFSSRHI